MTLQALIFDVDGTLAETEEVHRKAFNQAFLEADLDWHWSQECYSKLLAVSGGKERIRYYIHQIAHESDEYKSFLETIFDSNMELLDDASLDLWIASLHLLKGTHYAEIMASGDIELRSGVERLIREAHDSGLRLAIATTTSMENITALFNATMGSEVLDWFEVIGAAEQAPTKKPDSSVYLWVLQQLELSGYQCLAIEDTYNGLSAVTDAEIPVLITQSFYSRGENFIDALVVVTDLGEPDSPCQILLDNNANINHGTDKINSFVNVEQLHYWCSDITV